MTYETSLQLFIDGVWKSGEGRDAHPVVNPVNASPIAEVPYATKADLDVILAQPNHTQASRLAKALFGDETFQSVLNHRMKLLSLERSRMEAVKNAHLASAEWQQQQQAAMAQSRQQFHSSLQAAIEKLVAADDTCMGSSSAGAQGIGFGLSLGSTWTDGDCVRRKDARELHNMGYRPAAIALLCQSETVRKAMATAGTPCAGGESQAVLPQAVESNGPGNGSRNR